nr:retrovirus-related Pol polyprotein from transposon TNT 1-94 [Tanacetum cinerariifolium]
MALADDELTVGNSHARNGEWVDITIRRVNTFLSMDEDANWQTYLKILYYMICKREDHRTLDHEMYIASLKRSENYKAQPYQNHVPKVITPNEPNIPHTKDTKGPLNLINTEGTHEQNVQNDQIITQPTDIPSRNNTKISRSITKSLVPDVTRSHILNQASISSHPVPYDRWSRDQHIKPMNIIGDLGEGMLTRSMAAKLTIASTSKCLFANLLTVIEPKKALISKDIQTQTMLIVIWTEKVPQALISKDIQTQTMLIVIWTEKVPQVPIKYLVENCILWMKSQLSDYDIYYKMVPIFNDNTSAIAISNNLVLHSRTKHIDIRYHFIRDHILKGEIELHFIPTEYQLADIFTKPLDEPIFTRLKSELGMLTID